MAQAVADVLLRSWYYTLAPGWLMSGWYWGIAYTSFFREVCALELPGDLWDRARALELTAESAGWWWPHRRFVMVADRPQEIHRERVGERGWRLHNDNGPAISWRGGLPLYFVHGVHVPAFVVEEPERLTPELILAEQNTERRRVMLDRYGWERFEEHPEMQLVDECADPGNAGQTIRLYDLPPAMRDVLGTPVRLICVTNGSPDRNGRRRRYGLTVPIEMTSALQAAARTYGLDAETYAGCGRRT